MKVFIFLLFSLYSLYASTTLTFEKGWKLAGIATYTKDMTLFDNPNVEVLWAYDAPTQSWQGYSPNQATMQKIRDNNISTLSTLKPYQAFWILSKDAWQSELDTQVNEESSNNEIILKRGWNLLTLPNKAMIYKNFFDDEIIWKYNGTWSANKSSLEFPTFSAIKESEGFWVYSKVDKTIDLGEELSKLSTFASKEQMTHYLIDMIENNYRYRYYNYDMMDDELIANTAEVATDTSNSDAVTNATTTNIQERGVDEADILKHNEEYIFSVDHERKNIYVHSFSSIVDKNYTAIANINIPKNYIIEMYLKNNRLLVLSSSYDTSSKTQLHIYDISDITNITLLATHKIDGNYNDSRLIDGKLFLITEFYPSVSYEYEKIYATGVCADIDINKVYTTCTTSSSSNPNLDEEVSDKEECYKGDEYDLYSNNQCYHYNYSSDGEAWKYDYEHPQLTIHKLTPEIVSDDTNYSLITPSKFYVPKKLDQSRTITSLSSFDIASTQFLDNISLLGSIDTAYASSSSLYLASDIYPYYYNFYNYKQREMIYKFSLGETLSYKARGFIEGHMLNQFSMSEKDNYLRVATTLGYSWSGLGTDNIVYTLQENNETLEVKGHLSGLGKENESIKAVRFMGDRGFVVTFEQRDPLYTLDMSDPLEPKKVGELSIPGFSSYLHIVDENRVLSIGRNTDNSGSTLGLQLQLFDISDFSNPLLSDKIQIGDRYTYSSAEYNHKAFAYRSSDLLFGLPYRDYTSYDNTAQNFSIYKINDMSLQEISKLTDTNSSYWSNSARGIIFDLNATTYGALIDGSHVVCEKIPTGE